MKSLETAFGVPVGFSDHTIGSEVACAAVALGASLIEKHFTLDKKLHGPDHVMSLQPEELETLVDAIERLSLALGDGLKKVNESEFENRKAVRRRADPLCL